MSASSKTVALFQGRYAAAFAAVIMHDASCAYDPRLHIKPFQGLDHTYIS